MNRVPEQADERVYLDGYIDVPPDRLEAVRAALPEHVALTRAESGCLSFSVTPSDEIEGRFIVAEVFVDQVGFDAHQARMKGSRWFTVTEGIPREYTIRRGAAS